MKKSYLSLVLLIFILAGVAKLQAQTKEMYFTAFFTPGATYRFLQYNESTTDYLYSFRNQVEIPNFSFSAGAGLAFQINSFMNFEARVAYSEMSYKTKKMYEETRDMFGLVIANALSESYRFRIIEVPLLLNFDVGKEDVFFTGSVGVSPAYIADYNEKRISYKEDEIVKTAKVREEGFNSRFNLFVTVGAGFKHKVTEKLSYKILPEFRVGTFKTYSAMGLSGNSVKNVDKILWNLGLSFVINYNVN